MAYPFETYEKDPAAVLDYVLNWTDWLVGSDTIATAVWSVPTGITKDAESNDTTSATVWLSGGTLGQDYYVTCHVVTAEGREDDRTLLIQVRAK